MNSCECGHVHETVTLEGHTSVFHRCRAASCPCNEFRAVAKKFVRSKGWWVARAEAEGDHVIGAARSSGETTCDCRTLRIRLEELRNERLAIARLFGISPCYDDTPHSWSDGEHGNVSLVALLRSRAASSFGEPVSQEVPEAPAPVDAETQGDADDMAVLARLVAKYGAEQILRALPIGNRDPQDVTFFVDGRRKSALGFYRTKGFAALPAMPTMSGADIKRFGGGDATYHLMDDSDMDIPDGQPVIITEGARFYCVPPATNYRLA